MRAAFVIFALVISAWLCPTDTKACSAPCSAWISPGGGTVPANLPALRWRVSTPPLDEDVPPVTLIEVLADGRATQLPVTIEALDGGWKLGHLTRPLVAGATYQVLVNFHCSGELHIVTTDSVEFRAGPEAPLPTSLGHIEVSAQVRAMCAVGTTSGSCTSPADVAKRDVELVLSTDAAPWRNALLLDWAAAPDDPVFGLPRRDDTEDAALGFAAYAVCHSDDLGQYDGNPEGRSAVFVRATLPGSDVVLQTGRATVALQCEPNASVAPTCAPAPSGCGGGATSSFLTLGLIAWGLRRSRTRPA